MIIWFTGQPGSGKSTLAKAIQRDECFLSQPTVIDGEDLRKNLLPLGFSEIERWQNVDRAQAIAVSLHNKGYSPLVAVIAPYRDQRERFKDFVGDLLLEVYLHSTRNLRKEYHVKNYEQPLEHFVDINTDKFSTEQSIEIIKVFVDEIIGIGII